AVRNPANSQVSAQRSGSGRTVQDGRVLNRLNQSEPKRLQRNAEREIPLFVLRLEIDGRQFRGSAARRANVASSNDSEQSVYSTIRRSIRLSLKTNFPNRTVLCQKRRHLVLRSLAVRDQVEHGILRLPMFFRRILGIRHKKPARSTDRRLL